MLASHSTILVVPCYNEAKRIRTDLFTAFLPTAPDVDFLFVDDGSTDATRAILLDLKANSAGRVDVLVQPQNAGKAEAVRCGLLKASESNAAYIGFWDADLATPLDSIPEFTQILSARPDIEMVIGARVKLLGRMVERNPLRHYLGRVFATAVSVVLDLPIYDSQCGAKLFRNSPELRAILAQPFLSKWVFDVEILARTLQRFHHDSARLGNSIYELPLRQWIDVGGSKVRPGDFVVSFFDIVRIYFAYLRGR